MNNLELRKNELYQEIDIVVNGVVIGQAEVDIKGKMLSRLRINEPFQNNGYGTEVVRRLSEEYGLDCLWVDADNERAIHVYEKNGYDITKTTSYLMQRKAQSRQEKEN